jgi:hypothetical protein
MSVKETRIILIGVIALGIVLVGYGGVTTARDVREILRHERAMLSREVARVQVPIGSAVYLDTVSVAPIVQVVRHQFVWYLAGVPTDSAAVESLGEMRAVYGVIHGRYDGAEPVLIRLVEGTAPNKAQPDGLLAIDGRQKPIPLFLSLPPPKPQ